MADKKNEMKFTILFSPNNPDHVFAANKLNTQSRNNKANYVAQAIRFFEGNSNFDKETIERAVMDILDKQKPQAGVLSSGIEARGDNDDSFKRGVSGALEMFKRQG
jgi:hypothetical protein